MDLHANAVLTVRQREANRIRAYELLLAYGWGKPVAFVPIEGADPLDHDEVAAEIRSVLRR